MDLIRRHHSRVLSRIYYPQAFHHINLHKTHQLRRCSHLHSRPRYLQVNLRLIHHNLLGLLLVNLHHVLVFGHPSNLLSNHLLAQLDSRPDNQLHIQALNRKHYHQCIRHVNRAVILHNHRVSLAVVRQVPRASPLHDQATGHQDNHQENQVMQ